MSQSESHCAGTGVVAVLAFCTKGVFHPTDIKLCWNSYWKEFCWWEKNGVVWERCFHGGHGWRGVKVRVEIQCLSPPRGRTSLGSGGSKWGAVRLLAKMCPEENPFSYWVPSSRFAWWEELKKRNSRKTLGERLNFSRWHWQLGRRNEDVCWPQLDPHVGVCFCITKSWFVKLLHRDTPRTSSAAGKGLAGAMMEAETKPGTHKACSFFCVRQKRSCHIVLGLHGSCADTEAFGYICSAMPLAS